MDSEIRDFNEDAIGQDNVSRHVAALPPNGRALRTTPLSETCRFSWVLVLVQRIFGAATVAVLPFRAIPEAIPGLSQPNDNGEQWQHMSH